jgi:chromosome segregation ATPase
MAQKDKDGDYFRTARFGGFHKADVMRYIEEQGGRLREQARALEELREQLRESRREQLRWMDAARQHRKRSAAAQQVQRELQQFQRKLDAAQALAAEIERENFFLRERIRLLEEPIKTEPPSVPLEQLTFRLFLEGMEEIEEPEEGEDGEFAYLSV